MNRKNRGLSLLLWPVRSSIDSGMLDEQPFPRQTLRTHKLLEY